MPKKEYDNDRKLVGSMWKKESKKGNTYISIALEDPEDEDRKFSLVAFKNEKKKSENSPDYFIFWSPEQKKSSSKKKDDDEDEDDEF